MKDMYRFFVIVKRDIANLLANTMLMFYNAVFPFLLILVLGYLGNGAYSNGGADAYDYYGVTMLAFGLLNVSLTASNTFMERGLRNSNLRVLHSPVPASAVYLSKIVSTFAFTSVCFIVQMALSGVILGVNFGGANIGYVLALMLMLNAFSCALGVFFCCVFKSEEAANKVLSLVVNIFAIFGGVFFQLDSLGAVGAAVSSVSPVKWVLDAVVRIIWDSNTASFLPAAATLAGLTLLCIAGCKLFFRTEDYV